MCKISRFSFEKCVKSHVFPSKNVYDLLKKVGENLASGEFNDVPSIGLLFLKILDFLRGGGKIISIESKQEDV